VSFYCKYSMTEICFFKCRLSYSSYRKFRK
jgi:hypothetical protein